MTLVSRIIHKLSSSEIVVVLKVYFSSNSNVVSMPWNWKLVFVWEIFLHFHLLRKLSEFESISKSTGF